MILSADAITQIQQELSNASPQEILARAAQQAGTIAIAFSGAEDVALIDMATKLSPCFEVFCLDTGRLHPETYQFIEKIRGHYQIKIELCFPEHIALEALVQEKGLFSFYLDGHQECCAIRKVEPLKRKLATVNHWVTGQRKDQSPGTRGQIPVVQLDEAFSNKDHPLIKWNPLANWTSAQVWDYLRENQVPTNELHARGFKSIGCEPCTRAVTPEQHEREGRWWWEEAAKKECGLHLENLKKSPPKKNQ